MAHPSSFTLNLISPLLHKVSMTGKYQVETFEEGSPFSDQTAPHYPHSPRIWPAPSLSSPAPIHLGAQSAGLQHASTGRLGW